MGRAIVRKPQAFLMDEPLSNLDAKLRVEMRAEIARLQRDLGVTTVYVTHDQTEAMTMGDRVAVMRNGLLQQVDAPQVLYERPRNLFVAEFIGSPAMNLVMADARTRRRRLLGQLRGASPPARPATLERHPGSRRLTRTTGRPRDPARGHGGRRARARRPTDRRMSIVCDIREDMGSEVYVHFNVPADPVTSKELVEALVVDALEDAETEPPPSALAEGRPFVARLDRDTRAREREPLELAVDVARLHFFDPETGIGVGR